MRYNIIVPRGKVEKTKPRRQAKKFQKTFEKPLDKKQILCYNKDVRKREGKLLKTRKGITMKRNTIQTLVNYLTEKNDDYMMDIKAELEAELNKGAVAKAEKAAGYDAAWNAVSAVFALTTAPLTIAEIFEQAENDLPEGFTKGKVQYGLTHNWADRVVKIEGKPNTYRLA